MILKLEQKRGDFMAKKISSDQPLRSAFDYCLTNCKKEVDIRRVKYMTLEELNNTRDKCANCRSGDGGIYKTDAIATAIEAQIKVKELEIVIDKLKEGSTYKDLENEIKTLKEIIYNQQAKIKELVQEKREREEQKETKNPIETLQKAKRKPRGKVVIKRYGSVVLHLRKEGKTVREIASIVGISLESVLLCIHSNDTAEVTENE